MTLLQDLEGVSKSNYECTIGQILKGLPIKEATGLLKAIDDPNTSGTLLSRVLLTHGYTASRKTIVRHRLRGVAERGCACK